MRDKEEARSGHEVWYCVLFQALGDVRQRALEETRAAAASRAQAESAASAARADARAARDELARLQVARGTESVSICDGLCLCWCWS
jgi:hypothetical protein